jgi:hypothetical protein
VILLSALFLVIVNCNKEIEMTAVNDNFKGRLVSPLQLAEAYSANEWFRSGYLDAFKGIAYSYDISGQAEATAYERGRAFAIWCRYHKLPRAVWRNGVTAKTVRERLAMAIRHRAVI